ncbi:hypothetical protein FJ417_21990 [Mesorhizobium sp. B3-1-7]|uniref:hypothetical protein n=1 Tax=Mesorhizobium sp. B3-1-7 TaxID=2589894 RepID=UPI00112B67DB|nr:hypothetical protein [Mesorhizobium sp. B3-1-7]TPI57446.1 hypothetical protein FJ417_21990 [Mesorhizobium sp. B3-1-7]
MAAKEVKGTGIFSPSEQAPSYGEPRDEDASSCPHGDAFGIPELPERLVGQGIRRKEVWGIFRSHGV